MAVLKNRIIISKFLMQKILQFVELNVLLRRFEMFRAL